MNEKELLKLIEKGESEKVEFKESLQLRDEIGEALSAFCNALGGIVLVGVSDSEKIIGVHTGRNTLEELANYIKRNTDPQVYPSVEVVETDLGDVVVVRVNESHDKPVFFKKHAYKRIGKSSHRISSTEMRKLAKEENKKLSWDEGICESATLDDIDYMFVKDTFMSLYEKLSEKRIESRMMDLLKSMRCISNDKPTNAGILLFGKDPQKFFRNAYIALARYPGKEVYGRKSDYKEFMGNIFQQIDDCKDYLVGHTALMSKLTPGDIRRKDIPEYGIFSVRELITNAVCHRDYMDQGGKIIIKMFDDRIEFYNIGALPEWITPDNIISEQYSRNPVITKVLAKVEYIEELGEGWDKIIKEHKEHPMKPKMPEIKSSGNSTLVSLFSTKEKFEGEKYIMNRRQGKIMKYIGANGSITTRECSDLLNVSADTALRELSKLMSVDLINQRGTGRGVCYVIK